MTDLRPPFPTDFEPAADDLEVATEDSEPVVGRAASARSPVIAAAGFTVAALTLFLVLNHRRVERTGVTEPPTGSQGAQQASPDPPPLQLSPTLASTGGPAPFIGLPTTVSAPTPAPIVSAPVAAAGGAILPPASRPDTAQRLHAPAVVVDFGGVSHDFVVAQAGAPALGASSPTGIAAGATSARPQLNDSEQFAKRVGDEEPERARAIPMRNPHAIAPQGTIIPGVLETAINSDLPGFTRAVVSRDVLSFDGKAVLIPKGSRLIGQYKSAVALGQSRAFIIWTRVIRPDGVSIQIGSPGTDELGRGGLDGQVDRHFFRRFSGSIVLSVLNAGVAAIGHTPQTQISIGSPGAAAGIAGSVQGDAIPPTIRVPQGEAINIFVARDLDFAGVEPIR